MTNQITILPHYLQEEKFEDKTHTSLLIKLTRGLIAPHLESLQPVQCFLCSEKSHQTIEREREKNESDTMLLLQEPINNLYEASNI